MAPTYMIVIVDTPSQRLHEIVTDNIRVDFVYVGQIVHGRHWRGLRINKVVNRSRYFSLDRVADEKVAEWWAHVKKGLAKDAKIYDGVNRQ